MSTASADIRDATNDTAGTGPCDASPRINEIAAALAKAQSKIESAEKDRTNPHFGQAYSTLASVQDACRAHLTTNGIAVVQPVSVEATGEITLVTVRTVLMHSSGQWLGMGVTFEARDGGPQAVGSCITYGRRYGLACMAGVAPDDDDGNAGQGPEPKAGKPRTGDTKPMGNKFAGPCADCGATVAEQAGTTAKLDGKWIVKHWPGQCKATDADEQLPPGCTWSVKPESCEYCAAEIPAGRGLTSAKSGKTLHPQCVKPFTAKS